MKTTLLTRRLGRLLAAGLLLVVAAGCELDITNPNNAAEDQVLTTPDGLQALAVGMQEYYATTALSANMLVPGVTGREIAINTTFANFIELEDGGTALPATNTSVLQVWSRNYRVLSMADDLIDNVPQVTFDAGTESGLLAVAHLYKALALGNLAQNFEQVVLAPSSEGTAPYVSRGEAFAEAVRLLDAALAALDATPASATIADEVLPEGFDLRNTLALLKARYLLFGGEYAAALAAANAVDASATSVFPYTDLSQNPLFTQIVRDDDYAPRDLFGTPLTDPADARLDFWTAVRDVLSDPNDYPIETIEGFATATTRSIPVYLPGEIALIRAEAHVRQGNLQAAVDALNSVRTKTPAQDPFGVGAALPPYSGPVTEAALLAEVFAQRRAELFLQTFGLEDHRRLGRPGPDPSDPFARTRNFYPYPEQERLNNAQTPANPAI